MSPLYQAVAHATLDKQCSVQLLVLPAALLPAGDTCHIAPRDSWSGEMLTTGSTMRLSCQ